MREVLESLECTVRQPTDVETQEMLDFCGKHNINADVEVIQTQKVNEAYERLCIMESQSVTASSDIIKHVHVMSI